MVIILKRNKCIRNVESTFKKEKRSNEKRTSSFVILIENTNFN